MVIIQISDGKIKGKTGTDRQDKTYYSFQNIPYAAPPTGNLRFKAARPVEPWQNIRDCTKEGNECVSRHLLTKKLVGSEDCLNLNVYTPALPQDGVSLKPVMFWIHGGAFVSGSNKTELFGPEFLVAEDVVLVVINYRLGILGFLSLDDPTLGVPGNACFKDMVVALRWVQRNITHFCGDPKNVTVFGESAGASGAHLLMLSPMAKGLFHRVIAQSASALNIWVNGRRSARQIASRLGFSNTDDRKLLTFLQSASAADILKVQTELESLDFMQYNARPFGLVLERACEEEAFLTEKPIDIILSGNYSHVPMIIGYNYREGIAFDDIAPPRTRSDFFNNLELSIPFVLNIQRGSEKSKAIAEKIKRFYFGDLERNKKKHAFQYYTLCTDTVFLRDIYFSAKNHVKTSTSPVYFYKMSLQTDLNIFKILTNSKEEGVYHGDDLGYLFKTFVTPEIVPNSPEDLGQRRFAKLWTNFAKYGNPTPDQSDPLLTTKWKPVKPERFNYLNIGDELTMEVDPEPERMAFWTEVFKQNPACKL